MTQSEYKNFNGGVHHALNGHWNDPPQTAFKRTASNQDLTLDKEDIANHLDGLVNSVEVSTPLTKRMLDDIHKRLVTLHERLRTDKLDTDVLRQLTRLVTALDTKDYKEANAVHVELMQHCYDTEGVWLLGVKRLMDVVQKQS
jgi:hypothetical protein